MSEGLKRFVSFFELRFLPEERLRPSRSVRILIALGGLICLVFGALTSFSMGLAFNWLGWSYNWSKVSLGFYPLELQPHPHTYSLLLTPLGGAICLIASLRRRGRSIALLSLWGAIVGLIGLSLSIWEFTSRYGLAIGLVFKPEVVDEAYILGSGYSIVLLGIVLALSYPISVGVVHPVLSIPLVIPAFLNLLAYPQLPTLILMAQVAYTFFLVLGFPALVVLIPVNIAIIKAFGAIQLEPRLKANHK